MTPKNGKNWHVLSMGGGVNSIACLVKYGDLYDYVIFADTHEERPDTYQYLDTYVKPYCKQINAEFVTVQRQDGTGVMDGAAKKKWPGFYFAKRDCTTLYKIQPANEFLFTLNAKYHPIIRDVGFALDESHRMNHKWDTDQIKQNYPLAYDRITREGCKNIIRGHAWPIPEKSGCQACPVAGWSYMKRAKQEFPEAFARLQMIEENSEPYPRNCIMKDNRPLNRIDGQSSLDDHADDECDSGACFL